MANSMVIHTLHDFFGVFFVFSTGFLDIFIHFSWIFMNFNEFPPKLLMSRLKVWLKGSRQKKKTITSSTVNSSQYLSSIRFNNVECMTFVCIVDKNELGRRGRQPYRVMHTTLTHKLRICDNCWCVIWMLFVCGRHELFIVNRNLLASVTPNFGELDFKSIGKIEISIQIYEISWVIQEYLMWRIEINADFFRFPV